MFVLRPAQLTDLAQIEAIAKLSAIGITSLPPNQQRLLDKINHSRYAFSAEVDVLGEETYFFVLENSATGDPKGRRRAAARPAPPHPKDIGCRASRLPFAARRIGRIRILEHLPTGVHAP